MRYALRAFGAHSRYVTSPFSCTMKPNFSVPLLNFSKPPSVSSMVLIHFCAWLYRLRRGSLKGSSHGSSCITPEDSQLGTRIHVKMLTGPIRRYLSPTDLPQNGVIRLLIQGGCHFPKSLSGPLEHSMGARFRCCCSYSSNRFSRG